MKDLTLVASVTLFLTVGLSDAAPGFTTYFTTYVCRTDIELGAKDWHGLITDQGGEQFLYGLSA